MSIIRYGTFIMIDSLRTTSEQPTFGMLIPVAAITGVRAPEKGMHPVISYLDKANTVETELAFADYDYVPLCEAMGTASMLNKISVEVDESTFIQLMLPSKTIPVN
jgi:hypothetical protein